MKMLWRPTSGNAKTGNIPQGYVGETKEQTDASCTGCKWRRKDPTTGKGGGCYYWQGQTQGAHESMRVRERRHPDEYTLDYALSNARRAARYIRAAVGGDPHVFARNTVALWHHKAKAAGLNGVLAYTHFFNSKGSHLRGLAMASCDTLAEADSAVDAGWRVAVTITDRRAPGTNKPQLRTLTEWSGEQYTTPTGRKVVLCPAQVGRRDCNTCGLCDATNHKGVPIIGFLQH